MNQKMVAHRIEISKKPENVNAERRQIYVELKDAF